jgi:hypothetical protein
MKRFKLRGRGQRGRGQRGRGQRGRGQRRRREATGTPTAEMVASNMRRAIRTQTASLQRRLSSNPHGLTAEAIAAAFGDQAAVLANYLELGTALGTIPAAVASGQ